MEKRKERPLKNSPFTREQIRNWLEEYDLKDGKSIADFLKSSFGSFIQEALEKELDDELGYSRYDYKSKEGSNSRNGHHKKTLKTDIGDVDIEIRKENLNLK